MGKFSKKFKKIAKIATIAMPVAATAITGGAMLPTLMASAKAGIGRLAKSKKQPNPGDDSDLRPQVQTAESSGGFSPLAPAGIAGASACGASGGNPWLMIPTMGVIFIMYITFRYYLKQKHDNI